jgi:hypothetical protein
MKFERQTKDGLNDRPRTGCGHGRTFESIAGFRFGGGLPSRAASLGHRVGLDDVSVDLDRRVGDHVRCGHGRTRLARDVRLQPVLVPVADLVVRAVGSVHRARPSLAGRFGRVVDHRICGGRVPPGRSAVGAPSRRGRVGGGDRSGVARRRSRAAGRTAVGDAARMCGARVLRALHRVVRGYIALVA